MTRDKVQLNDLFTRNMVRNGFVRLFETRKYAKVSVHFLSVSSFLTTWYTPCITRFEIFFWHLSNVPCLDFIHRVRKKISKPIRAEKYRRAELSRAKAIPSSAAYARLLVGMGVSGYSTVTFFGLLPSKDRRFLSQLDSPISIEQVIWKVGTTSFNENKNVLKI